MLLKNFDREATVRKRVAGGKGVERTGEIAVKPFEADFHGMGQCNGHPQAVNRRAVNLTNPQ